MRLPTAPLVRSALAFFRPALALSERGTDLIQLPPESGQTFFLATPGFLFHFLRHMYLGLEERLRAYADAVGDFPCAMKEFKWRNGFWYNYSQLCLSKGFDDNMPMHTEYVEYCMENGLIQ